MAQFRICGFQRSGNHAIINWIVRNLGGDNYLFLNSCAPGDPFGTFSQVERPGARKKRSHLSAQEIENLSQSKDSFDHTIISYENIAPPQLQPFMKPRHYTLGYSHRAGLKTCVIWRSFPNWLASYYQRMSADPGPSGPNLLHATQLLGLYAQIIQLVASSRIPAIHYHRWLTSSDYRLDTLKVLESDEHDNAIGGTSPYGGGSSFTGKGAAPNPADLTHRWRELQEDPGFFGSDQGHLIRCGIHEGLVQSRPGRV